MPFKTFTTEIFTSSDVDTYLMTQVIIRCTSTTRPASPAEGWCIYEMDTDRFYIYQSSVWVFQTYTTEYIVFKGKDQSDFGANTPQNTPDDALVIPITKGFYYFIDGILDWTTTGSTDAVIAWLYPTDMFGSFTTLVSNTPDANGEGIVRCNAAETNLGSQSFNLIAAGTMAFVRGVLDATTAVTDGVLTLGWTRFTNTGNDATLKADSWLRARKLS